MALQLHVMWYMYNRQLDHLSIDFYLSLTTLSKKARKREEERPH